MCRWTSKCELESNSWTDSVTNVTRWLTLSSKCDAIEVWTWKSCLTWRSCRQGRVKWVKKVFCRRRRIVKGWAEVSFGGTAGTAPPIYRGNCPLASWTALFVAGTTWLVLRPTSKSSTTFYAFFLTQREMHISLVNVSKKDTSQIYTTRFFNKECLGSFESMYVPLNSFSWVSLFLCAQLECLNYCFVNFLSYCFTVSYLN